MNSLLNAQSGIQECFLQCCKDRLQLPLYFFLQDDLSLLAAHAIVDQAEQQLMTLYKQAQVIIHAEPYSESELKQKTIQSSK